MFTDKKGQFLLKSLKSVIITDSIVPVEKYRVLYAHRAYKPGLTFSTTIVFSGLVTKYHQNMAVTPIPQPTWVLHLNYRAGAVRSIQAVWITDRMSSLCLEETTFWHLREEWQHAVCLWRDIFLANEDTVKMHACTHIDKQDGRQLEQTDRLWDKTKVCEVLMCKPGQKCREGNLRKS